MSDSSSSATKGLRERLATSTEDRLGKALTDLLENPLLTGTIGRAFDSREKVAQAQELAMGALNLPSATDIERLTRRLRSVSQRLEGIEDGVHRLDRATGSRLSSIEDQLDRLASRLESAASERRASASPAAPSAKRKASASKSKTAGSARSKSAKTPAVKASGSKASASRASGSRSSASKPPARRAGTRAKKPAG